MAELTLEIARKMLDAAGFPDAAILASNDLDETLIQSLKVQGAKINIWGVGTKLATAYDQPALGGVYKLGAVRDPHNSHWQPKLKLSEQRAKISIPGILQVRRFRSETDAVADAIFEEERSPIRPVTIADPLDPTRRRTIPENTPSHDLLVPIFRRGRRVYELPALAQVRQHAADELSRFHAGVKRFVNPHRYPVGLEERLFELKTRLILTERAASSASPPPVKQAASGNPR